MGWWGTLPNEGDQYGDWLVDVRNAAGRLAEKYMKSAWVDAKRYGDYSNLYAAIGIVLTLAESEVSVDEGLWKDARHALDEVIAHVGDMGWNSTAKAKRDMLAVRARMDAIDEAENKRLEKIQRAYRRKR